MINADKTLQLLLSASLKGTLVLIVAWAWMIVLKRSSSSVRHWICSLALVSTITIPVLSLAAPVWSVPILPDTSTNIDVVKSGSDPTKLLPGQDTPRPVPPQNNKADVAKVDKPAAAQLTSSSKPTVPSVQPSELPRPKISIAWTAVALLLWLIGTLFTLIRWLAQAYHVWRITKRSTTLDDSMWISSCAKLSQRLKIRRSVRLVVSSEVTVPLTWGLWRPTIVLPAAATNWSAERSEIVLLHELAHIARWDYLTQWLALVSCAINWFNPFVWKLAQLLSDEREQACDDKVLEMGTKSSDYANNLLEISQAIRHKWSAQPGILAMGQSSNLARRIRRILDMGQSRRSLTRSRSVSMVLLLAIALLPLSTMQLSRASAQNGDITITVMFPAWQLPGRNGTPTGDALIGDFERAHPGVKIVFVEAVDVPDPADGIDAYFTAMQKAATNSDLVLTDNAGFPMAVTPQSTRAGYFLDLTPLIAADSSLKVDDFYPQVWKSFQWDHGMWAIPYSLDLAVLNYDKELFDKAGLAYPSGKWTLDDFANAATKLTLKDASGNRTQSGYAGGEYIWPSGNAALKQGLIGDTNLYDQTNIPGQPQFSNPKVEAVVDTWQQLTQQGAIGGVPVTAAMYVDNLGHMLGRPDYHPTYSLLPGNKAGLFVQGFGISAGSQHPELAYALAVYLTNKAENDAYFGIPARKTLKPASWYDDAKTFIDQAMPNGLPYSEMLLTSYLNTAWTGNVTNAKDAVQGAEQRAINDLKTADAKKGTLALTVNEPVAKVLPPGKIALKFDLTMITDPNANRDQWDRVIQDFVASDPLVGLVDVDRSFQSIDQAAANSDCFYLPTNQVPMITGDTVLDLGPSLNADSSFDKNDLVGNVLAQVQRDNKTYALPITIEPLVLQYDSAKFSAAKVSEPSNNWTIESFVDALRMLKQNSQGQGPFVDIESNGTYLLVLIADYGGLPLDYRTNPPTINFTDPATVTAIQQALDLAKNGYIRYGALSSFNNGPYVSPDDSTAISPVSLNGFSSTASNKPVLFPMGRQYTGLAYTLGTAYISAKAQNPEACYRFISTLAKHPELFAAMPVRRSVLTSQELKASTKPDVLALYNQVDTLLKDSHTVPIPSFQKGTVTISDYLLQNWLFEAFDAYTLNGADLGAALKNAEGYAKTYQGCTANLPPMLMGGPTPAETTKAYVECADKADSRLKPVLDPMVPR